MCSVLLLDWGHGFYLMRYTYVCILRTLCHSFELPLVPPSSAPASRGDLAASRRSSRRLVEFAQKAVLRLDRGLKRGLCRACRGLLVPGVTCTVRTRARPQRCQVWMCGGVGRVAGSPAPGRRDIGGCWRRLRAGRGSRLLGKWERMVWS